MKTAISLPDELFEEAERLGSRLHKSRSEVYRGALEDYLAKHDPDLVRDSLNRVLAAVGQSKDEFVATATARVLERTEW
jgi:antitoxin MazE6